MMASFGVTCFLTAIALVTIFQYGSALECYSCASVSQCETLNTTRRQTCGSGEDCLQIMHPNGVYERRCGTEDDCNLFVMCDLCETNLCNSSTDITPSILVSIILNAIVVKYFL